MAEAEKSLTDDEIIHMMDEGEEHASQPENDGEKPDDESFNADDLDALLTQFDEANQREGKPEQAIPYARFKEVNDKYKAEAEENARLNEQLKAAMSLPDAKAFADREQQYIELVNEGEWEKAVELRQQINTDLMRTAATIALRSNEETKQMEAARDASNRIWAENEWLHDNQDALDDFTVWRDAAVAKGMALPKALDYAIAKIAPLYAKSEDGTPTPGDREKTALERGLRDAKQQPPLMAGVGARSQSSKPKKASEYSEDEFEALPEAEKRKLKGIK